MNESVKKQIRDIKRKIQIFFKLKSPKQLKNTVRRETKDMTKTPNFDQVFHFRKFSSSYYGRYILGF